MLDGAACISVMFATQCHKVMRGCIEFVHSEQTATYFFGLLEPAVVGEQDRA
jgi:hypothetical protein